MSLVLGALGLELRYGARLLRWGCDEIVEFAHAVIAYAHAMPTTEP